MYRHSESNEIVFERIIWADIQVGDILRVQNNEV